MFYLICLCVISSCKENQKADVIVYNAQVYTADSLNPEVEAFAIKEGKFISIGTKSDVWKFKGEKTKILDGQSDFIMPGIIEGHAHFLGLGKSLNQIELSQVKSWSEIVELVKAKVQTTAPGEWIEGRGWHQEKWNIPLKKSFNGYPYHDQLSEVSPDNPVLLTHASGHAIIANSKAMELAGIHAEMNSPSGGKVLKDSREKLTGVFEENAMDMIHNALQAHEKEMADSTLKSIKLKFTQSAVSQCLKHGITSFHDAGTSLENIDLLAEFSNKGLIPVRLNVMLYSNKTDELVSYDELFRRQYNNSNFRALAVKAYMDGALGSYGAWLWEDYSDLPGSKGQNLIPIDQMEIMAQKAKSLGFQFCVHAIGDRANSEVLNLFDRLNVQHEDRWRIEHAQHIRPSDISLFKKMGIIASMQTVHCTSDAAFVMKRLGEDRSRNGAYIWRSLIDSSVHFANGTDAPVENINPFECIYAAVTRMPLNAQTAFFPGQCLTRDEALKSYTIWNAFASKEEHVKGSISVGKLADFIILDRNPLDCSLEDLRKTNIKKVYISGKEIQHLK